MRAANMEFLLPCMKGGMETSSPHKDGRHLVPEPLAFKAHEGGEGTKLAGVAPLQGNETSTGVLGPTLVQVFAEFRERGEDPRCILVVRRVQRLGARPDCALTRHYSSMPGFSRSVVVYCRTKSPSRPDESVRCKPSGMAFLIFSDPIFAELALAHGKEQVVDGVDVAIDRYKPAEKPEPNVQSSMPAAMACSRRQICEGDHFFL
jgi:hypothetical protein